MADTNGIAALLKALNETPGLGSGLKPQGVARSTAIAKPSAATSTAGVTGSRMVGLSGQSIAPRAAGAPASLPKILTAEGESLNRKAPRGSYLDIVV